MIGPYGVILCCTMKKFSFSVKGYYYYFHGICEVIVFSHQSTSPFFFFFFFLVLLCLVEFDVPALGCLRCLTVPK